MKVFEYMIPSFKNFPYTKSYLELIGEHLPDLLLPQHVEALLQHLPLVADVSFDWLEGHAEVETAFLDVAAHPVQLGVGELIFGVLQQGEGNPIAKQLFPKKLDSRLLHIFSK